MTHYDRPTEQGNRGGQGDYVTASYTPRNKRTDEGTEMFWLDQNDGQNFFKSEGRTEISWSKKSGTQDSRRTAMLPRRTGTSVGDELNLFAGTNHIFGGALC